MNLFQEFDIWQFFAGLGIFLFGMTFLEHALKNLSGRQFKKFIKEYTTNPIKGVLVGIIVTAILQSSSIVSLMVLSFSGAGLLQLKNAIAIIFGSNLGTTFTGWIVAYLGFKIDVEGLALPMVAIGGLGFLLLSNKEKPKEYSRLIVGFGFLLLGLAYMKSSIEFLANNFDLSYFSEWNPYLFALIGLVLTALIQSSSATMVITLSGLDAGIIQLDAAAAMVLGGDIGTTITALLGSINGTPSKKRVAMGQILFNVIVDVITLVIMYPLLSVIQFVLEGQSPLYMLVAFHNTFNLLGIVLMLPFINPFSRFLEKRFIYNDHQLAKYLHQVSFSVADAAIEVLKKETRHLSERVMYFSLDLYKINHKKIAYDDNLHLGNKLISEQYHEIKQLNGEVIDFAINVQNQQLDEEESKQLIQVNQALSLVMTAAKDFKDTKQDIEELQKSSNDSKNTFYKEQVRFLTDLYVDVVSIYDSENKVTYFERLIEIGKKNNDIYEWMVRKVYEYLKSDKINESELSTMLNLSREFHNANLAFIRSIACQLLSSDQLQDFNAISFSNLK